MIRPIATAAALVALATAADAAPTLQRVRGTVVSATDTTLTIKTRDGSTKEVTLAPTTKFASVVKSSLSDVGDGKFIGTATKGEPPVAIEVVIFPDSMKGTGEGHYPWDEIPDTTGGGVPTKSAMTNGTIKAAANKSENKPLTKSAMTNGTVGAATGASGGKSITVSYDNGKSLAIQVPPSAPIVAFTPADKSILVAGAPVFANSAVDGGKLDAKFVAVGKDGIVPPM